MWHKMSLIGKILVFTTGFGFGLATGLYYSNNEIINEGNAITIGIDGKVKKNSNINIDLNDINQSQNDSVPISKERKFLGLF